jgi:hypothetical protein
MRVAGFLLMPAGWGVVLTAVALIPAGPLRAVFVLAGMGVEVLGLTVAARSLAAPHGDER